MADNVSYRVGWDGRNLARLARWLLIKRHLTFAYFYRPFRYSLLAEGRCFVCAADDAGTTGQSVEVSSLPTARRPLVSASRLAFKPCCFCISPYSLSCPLPTVRINNNNPLALRAGARALAATHSASLARIGGSWAARHRTVLRSSVTARGLTVLARGGVVQPTGLCM